jgi:hypothetical protein
MAISEINVHKIGGKSIYRATGRGVPQNFDFLGPNGIYFARCRFRVQKSLDLQGSPLSMALVIDLPASKLLCPAPYKQH